MPQKKTTHRRSRHSSNPLQPEEPLVPLEKGTKGPPPQSDEIHHPYIPVSVCMYGWDLHVRYGEDVVDGCQGHGMDDGVSQPACGMRESITMLHTTWEPQPRG